MCFKDENGHQIITSRIFVLMSGNYLIGFNAKKYDRNLHLHIVVNSGEINFKLIDLTENKEIEWNQELYSEPVFRLRRDHKYRLIITSKKSSGEYRITVEKLI